MKKLYKFTGEDGETYNGFKWPLPVKVGNRWKAGAWTEPIKGELVACENGYHLTDFDHVFDWSNEEMYEVEYKGKLVKHGDGDKFVVRQARLTRRVEKWNDQTLRLFAVWCARKALKLIPNPDPRSVNACDVAERFSNGEATREELAAAGAAARDVARDAAWAAAWDAARAAAGAAARAAAWDAAGAAARDAARDAARAAQLKHLHQMLGLKK